MSQTGLPVSRGAMYIETHNRADGAHINEEARVVCVINLLIACILVYFVVLHLYLTSYNLNRIGKSC